MCGGRPVKKINMPSAKQENGKPGLALCNPHKIYLLFVMRTLKSTYWILCNKPISQWINLKI